jgi:hypothetical protein
MTTDELNYALAHSDVAFVYKSEGQVTNFDGSRFLCGQFCVDEVLLAIVESDIARNAPLARG